MQSSGICWGAKFSLLLNLIALFEMKCISCVVNSYACRQLYAIRNSLCKCMSAAVQSSMEEARQLFRDKERTEFIIVTIPTVMAVAESERLASSLHTEQVPVKRIVINQLVRI